MARSAAELMGLGVEAERLVRMGESRAEVSRRLGVHPQTLATWALRGGWRKKDLDLERSAEATRATILAVREGNARADRQKRLRQLRGFFHEAFRLVAEGSEELLEQVERMIGAMEEPKKLEAPKVELSPDPWAVNLRSIGEVDENEEGVMNDEHGVPWTPERLREHHRRGKFGGDGGFGG